jgi:hypothetical protein
MAAKKPEGIPLSWIVERDSELPPHRQAMRRRARERAMSTDGKTSAADAIVNGYVQLAKAERQRRETQVANASKPRGRNRSDDRRTTGELVADIVMGHAAGTPPKELLQHIHAAMEANAMEPIKDKWATALIRKTRAKR